MVFSLHPFHFWMNKLHADISPLPGHDGHDKPAGGSYFHHIHHAKYEYNYGTVFYLVINLETRGHGCRSTLHLAPAPSV